MLWSGKTGAHFIRGAIDDRYTALGRENGPFGYPTTDEDCTLKDNGCAQHFQRERGSIYWTSYTGAHDIRGLIRDRWAATGWEKGPLGYPTTDENCGLKNSGCFQKFQKVDNTVHPRAIYYTPTTGAHDVIYAGVLEQWAAANWENGKYGYPTNNPGTGATGLYINSSKMDSGSPPTNPDQTQHTAPGGPQLASGPTHPSRARSPSGKQAAVDIHLVTVSFG